MPRARYVTLAGLTLSLCGSLAGSGGYAWYLRSDTYRLRCAQRVQARLDLPVDIARVVPRSLAARQFEDVVVWLPDRRGPALTCEHAVVVSIPTADDREAYEIELSGGAAEISPRTWLRADYRDVLASGLRPGFAPDGPRRVTFTGMDVTFARETFRGVLRAASGTVSFEDAQVGHAAIACREFNGYFSRAPVFLEAVFSPHGGGVRVDHLELKVPPLPLAIVGLDTLLGTAVRSGTFSGRLTYSESGATRVLTVSGQCADVELSEGTTGFLPRPWRGRCSQLELLELRIENETPTRLRFAGVLSGLHVGDILAPWGLERATGEMTLRVRQAELSAAGVDLLIASGHCLDASLDALTSELGWGGMTGNLRIVIDDLTVENNRITSLNAAIVVDDATDEPNWIEGALLRQLLTRALKMRVPAFVPERVWDQRVEYTRLGLHLNVRDELLHVFGSHGPREKTILTVRLFDRDLPLVFEPEVAFDLTPWLDRLRAQAAAYTHKQWGRFTEGRNAPPGRAPAARGTAADGSHGE